MRLENIVPKSVQEAHEGEAQEEAESSPKLCHQGGERVDKLLLLDVRYV